MNHISRKLAHVLLNSAALLWRIVPAGLRHNFLTALLLLESRGRPDVALTRLFHLEDKLSWIINESAMRLGSGEHPKHRLMRYHDFFVSRIPAQSRVLDIGCGYGAVARSIAKDVRGVQVVGVELDNVRFEQAKAKNTLPNLRFVMADARCDLPAGHWDVVVLSNILEHIEDRVGFISDIRRQTMPDKFLIRVPLFERDWTLPMRKELGVNYFTDREHYIEHTVAEFRDELAKAGLEAVELQTLWGEIWSDCRPIAKTVA